MPRTTTYYGVQYAALVYEHRKGSPTEIKAGFVSREPVTNNMRVTWLSLYHEHNAVGRLAQELHSFKVDYVRKNLTAYTAGDAYTALGLAEGIDRVIAANCHPENWS